MALPICPRRIFGPCDDRGDIADAEGRAVLRLEHGLFDVVNVGEQADGAHIDLLQPCLDEAAAGVDVVVGELLLHLADAEAVGDQLVGIDAHLVFPREAAEAGNVHDVGHGLELLLEHPVFDGFQLHQVVLGIGAVQRVPVDLADGAPIGADLRLQVRAAE